LEYWIIRMIRKPEMNQLFLTLTQGKAESYDTVIDVFAEENRMRLKHIDSIQDGDIVAKPILLENGNVLVGVGLRLSTRFVDRLRKLGIDRVYIEDGRTLDIVPEDVIEDETRKEAVYAVHKTMTELIDLTITKERTVNRDLGSTFRNVFNGIVSDLSRKKNIMINLTNLHTTEGYLFHHSVNVAILAGILGMTKGYNRQQMEELGVGALLFDVGMTQIPAEVWNKKGILTEAERAIMRTHTEKGFDLLRNRFDISLLSAHCALQHHERYDGLGYPRGLKANDIREYAQIVAIADVFDALTSTRPYRNRFKPNDAIELLFGSGNAMFDLELIQLFCQHICIYPVSTTVMLSSGQIGVVSANHQGSIQRPVIRILHESDGKEVNSPYELDLRKELNITIISSL
jgi:HD-GYP domain-containing protein (c-di-GMP phosphodiesterase class II)